jgi:hypothetical protein
MTNEQIEREINNLTRVMADIVKTSSEPEALSVLQITILGAIAEMLGEIAKRMPEKKE